jgi:hypothetical protein
MLIYFVKGRRAIMKRALYFLFPLYQPVTINAQDTASIEVIIAVICRDVVDREPMDIGDSFKATVGRLYCFTKIISTHSPIEITHVWYFGNTERAKVNLSVNSNSWRTYSSKIIRTLEIGDWHVDVLSPDGEVLQSLQFKITEKKQRKKIIINKSREC